MKALKPGKLQNVVVVCLDFRTVKDNICQFSSLPRSFSHLNGRDYTHPQLHGHVISLYPAFRPTLLLDWLLFTNSRTEKKISLWLEPLTYASALSSFHSTWIWSNGMRKDDIRTNQYHKRCFMSICFFKQPNSILSVIFNHSGWNVTKRAFVFSFRKTCWESYFE